MYPKSARHFVVTIFLTAVRVQTSNLIAYAPNLVFSSDTIFHTDAALFTSTVLHANAAPTTTRYHTPPAECC
ncbi:hypothetical protein BDU57DRAFT_313753 [Ampelomyces quisqualis]|uniref:Secreted protein n=1 Tax=Ampelomyces quisqualis TaxID=50730 RepID=A0A6A5QHF5_AMPQU|nr:hypothetical protein BDU57DRAFT_313753 [Ampelomyces quisqualis]